jgi:acetoacetyl-CoA reductase
VAARTALVTGGTGAIGSAICRALAAAGCRVGALGHPSEVARIPEWQNGMKRAGHDVAVELCDLGDFDAAAGAVRASRWRWRRKAPRAA